MIKNFLAINQEGVLLAKRCMGPQDNIFLTDRENTLAQRIGDCWNHDEAVIIIGSLGIAVRTVAPYLKNKWEDPPVIAVDSLGKFVIPVAGGHHGANQLAGELAEELGGQAVMTTASDLKGIPALDVMAIEEGWEIENKETLPRMQGLLNSGQEIRICSSLSLKKWKGLFPLASWVIEKGQEDKLLLDSYGASRPVVFITDKLVPYDSENQLMIRPKRIVVGIGFRKLASEEDLLFAIESAVIKVGYAVNAVRTISTWEGKNDSQPLKTTVNALGAELSFWNSQDLNGLTEEGSTFVRKVVGAGAVAEPAALLASNNGKLLLSKTVINGITIAISEKESNSQAENTLKSPHRPIASSPIQQSLTPDPRPPTPVLYVVGIGPGDPKQITLEALEAIKSSEVIVGYRTYIKRIEHLLEGKEVFPYGMGQEMERCQKALETVKAGKTVSLVSGGDPGIYGMAGALLELNASSDIKADIKVIPGISALNAAASALGAPLNNDFGVISLSDILTPWPTVRKRLAAFAKSQLAVAIYNPASSQRKEQWKEAIKIFLQFRPPDNLVGIWQSKRGQVRTKIVKLADLADFIPDMKTTVLIAGVDAVKFADLIIAPRGYDKKIKKSLKKILKTSLK